jgi:iron complex outermembrane receptor protein
LLAAVLCPGPAAHAEETLQEIVVTAQKRAQRIQDVPVSVTALTADALVGNRVQNVTDLNALAPNLQVRTSQGGGSLPIIILRGEIAVGGSPGEDRAVGMYLDGVYLGNAIASLFDLAEIERIEVLKGPQGTLFGRNATGGAISIVTPDPKGQFDFRQDLTYGNYDQFRSKTHIETPAFGPFSASLSYLHSQRNGDTKNLGAGPVWDYSARGLGKRKSPTRLGDKDLNGVMFGLKFAPTDNFKVVYKFDWSSEEGTPIANGLPATNFAALGPSGPTIAGIIAAQPNPSLLTPVTNRRPDAVNNNNGGSEYVSRGAGHNITASWQVTDHFDIKNILAYRSAHLRVFADLSGEGGIVVPFTTIPFIIGNNFLQYDYKQFSDELVFNLDTRLARITAGLVHFNEDVDQGALNYFFRPLPGLVFPGDPTWRPAHVEVKSDAAYGQAEFHIAPKVDLVAGYRVTRDKKNGSSTVPGFPPQFSTTATNPSYLGGVNYKPTEDILIYGKFAQGYVSGGSTFGLPYGTETAKSYEAGLKSEWLQRRLRTNLALYTVRYDDLQFHTSGTAIGYPQLQSAILNAGAAQARGFELEASALPINGLTLTAGLGYTDFKFLSVLPVVGTLDTFLPYDRPKWTANLAAQYDTRPLFDEAYLSFRLDDTFRSRALQIPDAPASLRNALTTQAYSIVNGRIALADLPVAGHKADLALWVKNLTNDDHMAFISNLGFIYPTNFELARTYGVDLSFKW